jgi:hypothetical protein
MSRLKQEKMKHFALGKCLFLCWIKIPAKGNTICSHGIVVLLFILILIEFLVLVLLLFRWYTCKLSLVLAIVFSLNSV